MRAEAGRWSGELWLRRIRGHHHIRKGHLDAAAVQMRSVLRLGRATDLRPKTALGVLLAMAVPGLVLLAVRRVDLMVYTVGGSTCALYGRSLPYAARALACVVLGMVVSNGGVLATAAATSSTAVRVTVAALLAVAHKLVCEATRIGPRATSSSRSSPPAAPSFHSASPTSLATSHSPLPLVCSPGWCAWPRPRRVPGTAASGGGQGPDRCRPARSHSGRRPCPCPGLPSCGRSSSRSLAHGVADTRPLPGTPDPGTATGPH